MDFLIPPWANTQRLYDLMRPRYRNAFVAGWFPHLSRGALKLQDIGQLHNATFSNAPTPKVSRPAWVFSYNGSSNYLTISHDSALNPPAISLAMMFRFTANPSNYEMLIQKDVDSNWDNGYGIFYYDGKLQFYYGKGANSWTKAAAFTLSSASRDWHYVVGTYDGTTRRIWLDQVPGTVNTDALSAVDGAQDMYIGTSHGGYYPPCEIGPTMMFSYSMPDLYHGLWESVFTAPIRSSLKAESAAGSTVQLTWTDNSDNESGFSIERSTTSATAGFAEIATVGAGVTSYDDTGLAADTYWYRVRSYDASGRYSDYSDVAEVTVT